MKKLNVVLILILIAAISFLTVSCDKTADSTSSKEYEVSFSTGALTHASITPPATKKVKAGETITEPILDVLPEVGYKYVWTADLAKKDIYDFESPVHSNIKLYALQVKKEYSVQYLMGGGVNDSKNITAYDIDTEFTLNPPKRGPFGYRFIKWYAFDDVNKTKVESIQKNTMGDIVLAAEYEPISYTVLYYNAQVTDPASYTFGTTIDLPVPTKAGYTFAGWYAHSEVNSNKWKLKVENLNASFVETNFDALAANGSSIVLDAKWEIE